MGAAGWGCGAVTFGGQTGAGTTAGAGAGTTTGAGAGTRAGAGAAGGEGSGCGGSCSAGTVVTGRISGTDCAWFPVANPATRARKAETERPATPIFAFRAGETRETRGTRRARGLVIVAGGFVFGFILGMPALVVAGIVAGVVDGIVGTAAAGGLSRPGRGGKGAAVIPG